ncbi:hypothetical protein [uncultured Nocardioides sp.]|uniref:hypothetical protein n=1 Tax=uncultured Nocardioides sp. TaxID=198441 RepID=UPI002623681C|nr:hypothetical protein [uncultured Nocardioides sp.]
MSTPVDLGGLDRAIAQRLPGYLVTVSARGRVRTASVEPRMEDGRVVIDGAGPGVVKDLRANPALTLILPPATPDGFTLLVDGDADRPDRGSGRVWVTPSDVVMHRSSGRAAIA